MVPLWPVTIDGMPTTPAAAVAPAAFSTRRRPTGRDLNAVMRSSRWSRLRARDDISTLIRICDRLVEVYGQRFREVN
jgi:hypothetical protein